MSAITDPLRRLAPFEGLCLTAGDLRGIAKLHLGRMTCRRVGIASQ